jgi:hypothetical protein
MTNAQKLHYALTNDRMIAALVRLPDGQRRVRVGAVHSITHDLVTIYDIKEGWRSTHLVNVLDVAVQ